MFVLAEKRKHFAPLRKMRSTEFWFRRSAVGTDFTERILQLIGHNLSETWNVPLSRGR
jgi:hypothetical protein